VPHHHDAPAGPTITVLTGAGISTGGGIPDFRGPQGVWTRDPAAAELLDIDRYMSDADVRRRGWASWLGHPVWRARPTRAHRALVDLQRPAARPGPDAAAPGATSPALVLTQNFDGLHQAAGSPADLVVELHGTLATTSCLRCERREPTPAVLARLDDEPDPHCPACGGVLKVDVVYFGERLPDEALERAIHAAQDSDVFVTIGTTLTVQPVAGLAGLAADAGAELIVVNAQPTPYDRLAARVIREPIDEAVPALVDELLGR
jgi:NAD-dependent deacetylase